MEGVLGSPLTQASALSSSSHTVDAIILSQKMILQFPSQLLLKAQQAAAAQALPFARDSPCKSRIRDPGRPRSLIAVGLSPQRRLAPLSPADGRRQGRCEYSCFDLGMAVLLESRLLH